MNKEEIENINKKLNTTEDDQMTINLLYQKVEILESILDKVTEECRKQITTYEDSILEIFPGKLLNIIEGEENKLNSIKQC